MKSRRSVSPIYNVLDGVASPVRLRMLRSLARQKLGYSELAKAVGMDRNKDAGKFSYHLKKLLSCGLIEVDSSVGKYTLSQKGATVLKYLDKIEEELGEKTLMIVRRSDQLIEPFNKDKISEALVKEARLSPKLAREIASIAEKKLLDLKIDYLTAPLIRELVNSILLDMGLEKYRHRLTRLGMPLYDAERLLKKTFSSGDWRIFLEKSSGSIAREYALLDLLPREVAELHLTGRIDIYPISSWVTGFFARKLSIDPGDVIKSSVKIVFASFSTKKEIKISGPRQQVKKILEALSRMPLDKRLISLEYSDSTLESVKNLDTQSRKRLGLIVNLAKLDLSEVGKVNKTLMKARLRHVYSTSDEVGFTGFVLDEERRDLHSIISINVLGAALEEKGDLDATLQRISDYVKLVIPIVKRELSLINRLHRESSPYSVIALTGLFEASKYLARTKSVTVEEAAEISSTIIDEMRRVVSKESKNVLLGGRCPVSAAKRFMRIDVYRYGNAQIRNLIGGLSAYSMTPLPPLDNFKSIEAWADVAKNVAKNLSAGCYVSLRDDRPSRAIRKALTIVDELRRVNQNLVVSVNRARSS